MVTSVYRVTDNYVMPI